MKSKWIAFILCLAAAISLHAGVRIIPIAGHLPGANGSSWSTDVSLTNGDSVPRSAQLLFHTDAGTVTRTVVVPANGSLLLDDAVRPDRFNSGAAGWLGQLEVRSDGNVSASAHTFTTAANGGTYGSSYESYDPSVLASEGAVAGLLNGSAFRSNVAYANAGDAPAVVSYNLRGANGALLASSRLAVPAHTTVQLGLSRDVAPSSDDAPVLLEWSSTSPLYVIASVVDNRSNDPANFPSLNAATELFFPVVGRTAGAQSTFWSTSAAISSRSDAAGEITFAYRDNGTGTLYAKTVAIAPRGTIYTADVNTFAGAPDGSGSLTITSTVRVAGSVRVFNTLDDKSTYGSALLPQAPAVSAPLVVIKGVRRDDAFRLNVSLSSHTAAADGVIRLRDDHGNEVENEPFHVEADRMLQFTVNHSTNAVRSGELEIETHNGASVTAVASSVDNRTGDTSVHESEQENERQHDLEIRISPSTASAGAPVSFSLENSSGVASVRWSFGDGTTANGLTASHAYATAGEFTVSADVTLTGGAVVRDREDVHIVSAGTPVPPATGAIDFTWSPKAPQPGQQVTFTASGTTNGGSFKWKFPGSVRVSGAVATFTFAAAGSYEVELELEHAGSTTPHATHIVTVGSSTPSNGGGGGATATAVDFTWSPSSPRAGQTVTFNATTNGALPAGAFLRWRMPDDSRPQGASASFTFAAAGTYRVRVQIERPGQPSIEREKNVVVTP